MKYRNLSCCIIDFGLFTELCYNMGKEFGTVYYHNPTTRSPFPSMRDATIGYGIPKVKVIEDLYNYKDKIDLFIFPDVFCGDMAEDLKKQGKNVWSSGNYEWMELQRWKFLDWLKKNNMPVAHTEESIGVDELEKDLNASKDEWIVKIDRYRGDMETFPTYSPETERDYFKTLRTQFGERANEISFMRQRKFDAVEIGYDGQIINGKFPPLSLWGYELKGSCYIGRISSNYMLPESVAYVNKFLSEELKDMCGSISTEIRISKKDKKFYFIDPCQRFGNPPNQSQLVITDNLAEIFMEGSQGRIVKPQFNSKYVAQCVACSEYAVHNEMALSIPDQVRPFVKLKNLAYIHGKYYVIPPEGNKLETVGAIVGVSNVSYQDAIENCKKNAACVKGFRLEIDTVYLDSAAEIVAEGKSLGVKF